MSDRSVHPVVSRPLQARFLSIPQTPLCYWLRERFFELLAGRTVGAVADVCQGLATADDGRFVRFVWETPPSEWAQPVLGRRWVPFEKGGGYGKWFGHQRWVVDWEQDGTRIKVTPAPRVQNEQHYFREGWTYSYMARGSLGLRRTDSSTIFSHLSSTIFFSNAIVGGATATNCHFASSIVRSISAKIQLNESYVSRVPLPEQMPNTLATIESLCITLKRRLVALDPTERSFVSLAVRGTSLIEVWRILTDRAEALSAGLHTIESLSEREVFLAYGIAGEDLQTVMDETGTPAGWFPFITEYDAMPEIPAGLSVPEVLLEKLAREERRMLPARELTGLKQRLQSFYEAGAGGKADKDEGSANGEDENEAEGDTVSGARLPIPAETFIEELAQKLEIHPISIYWLLRELRDKDGVVCKPELIRFVEDYLSVMILRLLGHQWPREIEASEPVPEWAVNDGIIPVIEGTSVPSLPTHVRARLAEDFGADRVTAIEREFEEITGRPLTVWLSSDFFKRHISQFKKRPIAWHITSAGSVTTKRRGRGASQNAPAFSCLVYYHRLDADLLPKLRTQYVGPLRTSWQTELTGLEKIRDRSANQDTRRLELETKIEELKAFDARLERVIVDGFASPALDNIAAEEPLDTWTLRDGRAQPLATREAFLAQERRYDPDLNDGVRVNIAPLQRAGLLAADVLAAKDIEKAIADRAEWRADERRWCREGKLPQPGWWPVKGDET